jgi:hypothetical protein
LEAKIGHNTFGKNQCVCAPVAAVFRFLLLHEILNPESSLTNNRPQGTAIQFLVIEYNHLGKRLIAAHDDVAAPLSYQAKAKAT